MVEEELRSVSFHVSLFFFFVRCYFLVMVVMMVRSFSALLLQWDHEEKF